jgi:hypothetical protein
MVSGGNNDSGPLASAELYDPASDLWTETTSLNTARGSHTATLLPSGKIVVAGGENTTAGRLTSAEIYDVGLGFSNAWRPRIGSGTSTIILGRRLRLTGSRFQGVSQASGGNYQDSSTNYPVVQLRSIDNSQVTFLFVDPVRGWSDTSFISVPVGDFPFGPALATVFTNGIPSDAKYLVVTQRDR